MDEAVQPGQFTISAYKAHGDNYRPDFEIIKAYAILHRLYRPFFSGPLSRATCPGRSLRVIAFYGSLRNCEGGRLQAPSQQIGHGLGVGSFQHIVVASL